METTVWIDRMIHTVSFFPWPQHILRKYDTIEEKIAAIFKQTYFH